MVRVGCWLGGSECQHIHSTGCGQIIRPRRRNSIRICSIPSYAMRVRRQAVDVANLPSDGDVASRERITMHKWRIPTGIQCVGLEDIVKSDPDSAAQDDPAAEIMPGELPWAPSKTDLRAEVGFLS